MQCSGSLPLALALLHYKTHRHDRNIQMFSFFLNYLLLESHVATAFVNIKGLVGCDLVCQDSLHRALMQSITRHENQARRKSRKPRSLETTAHLCLPEKRTFNSDNKAVNFSLPQQSNFIWCLGFRYIASYALRTDQKSPCNDGC